MPVIHGLPQALHVFLDQCIYHQLPKVGYTKIRIKTISNRLSSLKYDISGL
jgi:hypothetical protein